MADRPEMFGTTRGLSKWQIQRNHAKCCGADPCCHGNEIWARRGDLVAYRLVFTIFLSLKVFYGVLSRTFLSCRERDSSCRGSISAGDATIALKQSVGGDQSTNTTPGESIANQRDWTVLVTVLDRICFTFSVTAVIAAVTIFFPR